MENVHIDTDDVTRAVKAIRNGKAGGTDGMIGELVKYGGEKLICVLKNIFNDILEEGEI